MQNKSKLKKSDFLFQTINTLFLLLLGFACLAPMLHTLAVSFSGTYAVLNRQVTFIPVDFSLEAYKTCFESSTLLRAYGNTLLYTSTGTLMNLLMVTLVAYPLSKYNLQGRRGISFFFYFTNLFSGGMIPTFLIVQKVGFIDTIWALIIPASISVFYSIVLRTNFEGIPPELEESAKIDGLGHWNTLIRIYMPLSKAIYAALVLFFAVTHWNSFFDPMIYLNRSSKYPLQVVLRNIVIANEMNDLSAGATGSGAFTDMRVVAETLKSATIVLVIVPILAVYPFVQKYFIKGVMVGAVKG